MQRKNRHNPDSTWIDNPVDEPTDQHFITQIKNKLVIPPKNNINWIWEKEETHKKEETSQQEKL